MTLCRSRVESGGAKAQRRKVSMPYLVLGSPTAVLPVFAQTPQFAGHSKAEAHCLRSGPVCVSAQAEGSALDIHVNNAG